MNICIHFTSKLSDCSPWKTAYGLCIILLLNQMLVNTKLFSVSQIFSQFQLQLHLVAY